MKTLQKAKLFKMKGECNMTFEQLTDMARKKLNPRKISSSSYAGSVASALYASNGKVYTGVCIDTPSSMGFCAEHAAIAAMITDGETKILKVVSVYNNGEIIPPCGRCREFIIQIDDENDCCEVKVNANTVVTIKELLPYHDLYK